MQERCAKLDQAREQIKADCWDRMEVHLETVSAIKAPLQVSEAIWSPSKS